MPFLIHSALGQRVYHSQIGARVSFEVELTQRLLTRERHNPDASFRTAAGTIAGRLIFGGNIVGTGADFYRLAATRAVRASRQKYRRRR
jgi:hypothetical protein